MIFRIEKSYESRMTVLQIHECLEHFLSKTSSFSKAKRYDVQFDDYQFSIQKCGGSLNGPAYPLIDGRITQGEYVRVDLDIKPSYFLLAFVAIFPCIFLPAIFLTDEMKINGIYRMPTMSERAFWAFFSIAIPAILCYFKTIKPTRDAEKWLVRKLALKEIATRG